MIINLAWALGGCILSRWGYFLWLLVGKALSKKGWRSIMQDLIL